MSLTETLSLWLVIGATFALATRLRCGPLPNHIGLGRVIFLFIFLLGPLCLLVALIPNGLLLDWAESTRNWLDRRNEQYREK